MEKPKVVTCKNCRHTYEGYYCNICRQSADTSRITWKEISHHFLHALFHVDKGLFYTAKEMLLRPGKTILEYLEGKRIYHFNPLLFLILLGGTASLLYHNLHVNVVVQEVNFDAMDKETPILAHKYFLVVGGIVLLYLTLTDFLFYWNKKIIIPELIVSNTLQIGELLIFLIILLPFLYLQKYVNTHYAINIEIRSLIISLFFCYLFLVRYQFYEAKKKYFIQIKILVQLVALYFIIDQVGPLKLIMELRK